MLLTYIPACLRTLGQSDPGLRDTMYSWGDMYTYGREAALRGTELVAGEVPQRDAGAGERLRRPGRALPRGHGGASVFPGRPGAPAHGTALPAHRPAPRHRG